MQTRAKIHANDERRKGKMNDSKNSHLSSKLDVERIDQQHIQTRLFRDEHGL